MAVNKWMAENPEAARKIRRRYYDKNKEIASLRSRKQHHIGRAAFKMLTEDQKTLCIAEVERLLQMNNEGENDTD